MVLLVGLFVFTVIFFMRPLSASAATVDISQTVTTGFWNDPLMGNTNMTWHNVGQSFFPSVSSINSIKVYLTRTPGTNQTDYYLDLYKGSPTLQASYTSLGTAMLPYTSIVESTDGNQEANFVFSAAIALVPNDPYFFRLSMASYSLTGVHSRVAWSSQIAGELLAWGALPQADNLQAGTSNLEMYFITYSATTAEPLAITTTTLPVTTVGATYNQALASTGGTAPLTWSLSAGALPAGLTLSSAGVISGIPTIAGTASFTVRVTDNVGATVTSAQTITVQPPANTAPVLSFSLATGYITDGVNPSVSFTNSPPTFKVAYSDADNNPPAPLKLFINNTSYNLSAESGADGDFSNGEHYTFMPLVGTLAKGLYNYYFTASDGSLAVRLPAAGNLIFEVRNVPVILIPGILGTELKKGNDLLWMDVANIYFDVGDIFLLPLWVREDGTLGDDGVSVYDVIRKKSFIYDISDRTTLYDYFDGLINEFSNNGYVEGDDLFVFPYDWRLDNRINALNLKTKIDAALNQTSSPKVDIVAHSMGGLVTKQYILQNSEHRINSLIFLGTPHLGTPKALKALLFGDGFGFPLGLLSQSVMKRLAYNMFSSYQLLPSQTYVNNLGGYYYDYTSSTGPSVYTYQQVKTGLLDSGYNTIAIQSTESFHTQEFDSLSLEAKGINAYNIVGCNQATIQGIIKRNKPNQLGETEYNLLLGAGDETVFLGSATGINLPSGHSFYATSVKHSKMPSNNNVRQLVVKLLTNTFSSADLPASIRQDDSQCVVNGKLVSLHSPVAIDIYDQNGNHVGYNTNGQLEENIPGVTYEELDGNSFVFLPDDILSSLQINLRATGSGSFNMRVSVVNNSNVDSVTYYNNVPITSVSTGNIVFDSSNNPSLQLDINNTGNTTLITPSSALSGQSITDSIAPQTSASLIGSLSSFGMYESVVEIILDAADNSGGSGLLKTVYSLDSGQTWQNYNGNLRFEVDGEYQFKYQSIDKVGNRESEKGIIFRIAKPPGRGGGGGSSISQPLVINSETKVPVLNPPTIISESSYMPKAVKQDNAVTDVSDTTIEAGKVAGVSIEKKTSVSDIIGLIGVLYNNGSITKKFIRDRLINQLIIGEQRFNRLQKIKQQCRTEKCKAGVDKWLERAWSALEYEIGIRRGKYIKEEGYKDLYKNIELIIN